MTAPFWGAVSPFEAYSYFSVLRTAPPARPPAPAGASFGSARTRLHARLAAHSASAYALLKERMGAFSVFALLVQ